VKEITTASVIQSCAGLLKFYTSLQQDDGITKSGIKLTTKKITSSTIGKPSSTDKIWYVDKFFL